MSFADVVAGINAHELAAQLHERKRAARNATKKQNRRSISVRGEVYSPARVVTEGSAASLSAITEGLLALFLRGEIDPEKLAGAISRQPDRPGINRSTPEERARYAAWVTRNG